MNTKTQPFSDAPLARRMLEISPAAAAVIDPDGTILFVNEKLTELLGYTSEELVGRPSELFFPSGVNWFQEAQLARCVSQSDSNQRENEQSVVARDKNGHELHVTISVHQIANQRESPLLAHLVRGDQPSVDHDLLQSERLAAIAQMVSGLAHESRNALQRAVACLDLLELDLKNNPEQMILSQRIRDSLGDLIENYDEVRRYAEPITLKPQRVNLLHLCQVAFDEIAVEHDFFPHQLEFSRVSDRDVIAQLDREKMKQVFLAILENAIDAADEIARIEVACKRIRWQDNEAVKLTIHDHGHGFQCESLPKVFEPFYTTKQHGTGLGLAICRRIVEAHRGEIRAANHADGGGIIEMTLSVHPQPLSLPRQSPY
ncbi:Sensor protein FixL [Novipirellula galeiformis]|uniref:histidine kinase n=1 Tax=Novipirellula galeiformis TaxID=2528004 RepID=A0A5C6CGA4_9BACT|nr:ATP-binding protein [Novipirellula galeiformis]TWU22276.1 Sensor protein FixL [Novipirellula galeiformis]